MRNLFWLVIAPAVLVGAVLSLDLPLALPVAPYRDGVTALYLDRPYANTAQNPGLGSRRVVQVPRHLRFEVELELSAPAEVTRLLCDRNDNSSFAAFEPDAALRVAVPGRSCTLTRAVTRSFPPGMLRVVASPLTGLAPNIFA